MVAAINEGHTFLVHYYRWLTVQWKVAMHGKSSVPKNPKQVPVSGSRNCCALVSDKRLRQNLIKIYRRNPSATLQVVGITTVNNWLAVEHPQNNSTIVRNG